MSVTRWAIALGAIIVIGALTMVRFNILADIEEPLNATLKCQTPEEAAKYLQRCEEELSGRGWSAEATVVNGVISHLNLVSPDPGAREFSLRNVKSLVENLLVWNGEDSPGSLTAVALGEKYRYYSFGMLLAVMTIILTTMPYISSLQQQKKKSVVVVKRRKFDEFVQG